ncbi:MAG: hypothetical protein ABIJ74_01005 [archaeon]
MFSVKGQGTVEYLVLIGLLIVIALVVVGVFGSIPGLSTGINENQSKIYWNTTYPLSLKEWKITAEPTEAVFVVQNLGTKPITLTEITVNGIDIGVEPDVIIPAGQIATVSGITGVAGSSGENYEFEVKLTYSSGVITRNIFTGQKPIAGKILPSSAASCSCGSWNNVFCGGSCSSDQMQQTRSCNPAGCDIESQCIDDSCSAWADNSCGGNGCSSTQLYQTRTCNFGCAPQTQCVNDSCTAWLDGVCGGGSCDLNQTQQTRTCSLGCDVQTQCVDDSCTSWGADYCVNEQLCHDRTCDYGCLPQTECPVICDPGCCDAYCVSQGRTLGVCNTSGRCRCFG